jgi:LPXTG-motif cell wall-anchored protein
VVSWVGLRIGIYFVQETAAPTGYELPGNTVLTVRVDGANAGGTLQRSFYDPQRTTTLEVVKQDDDTNEVLAGATFQAYQDVDRDGTLGDDDVRFGDPRVTDANGVARWPGLGFGHYLVEEVAPPAGYGLPETTTMSVVLDRDNAGGTVRRVFLDPALGTMSVSKAALERDAAGDWVASDGEVGYGDPVKYVIVVRGDGARLFRDAIITDYIPGYDPADSISTTRARYVAGSADCGDADCTVSFDSGSQRLTWSLGDLRDEQRTLQFVVRTPGLPANPVFDEHGDVVDTIANVTDLSWQEPASLTITRRTSAFVARSIRSNTVLTTIIAGPEVLDTPPAERPMPAQKPQEGLPDTGGPAHSDLITTAGGLAVLLGAWLMLVSRRRGCLPQR